MEVVLFTKQIGCLIFLPPPKRSFRQVNVFTPVFQSFCSHLGRGVCLRDPPTRGEGSASVRSVLGWSGLPTGGSALGWSEYREICIEGSSSVMKGSAYMGDLPKKGSASGRVFLQWVCLQEGSASMG